MTALLLIAAALLLIVNAFFVAAEFAAVSVRKAQLEPLAHGSRRAARALDALSRLSLLLAGAQLGITLCSLGLGTLAEPAVADLLESPLVRLHVPHGLVHPIAFAVALTLVAALHMILGEMVPKNVSLARAEVGAIALVPALDRFVMIAGPVIRTTNAVANASLRLFGIEPRDELADHYSAAELASIISESRAEGLLGAGAYERLERALTLTQRTARDVLLPLDTLTTVAPGTTRGQLEALAADTGFSRYPVQVGNRLDGYLHVKDLFAADDLPAPRPMPAVAANLPLSDVVARLRRGGSHLAVVLADGRTLGMVTLEDAVEQLTGTVTSRVADPVVRQA